MILEMYSNGSWQAVSGKELLSLNQVEISQSAGSLSWDVESQPTDPFAYTENEVIGLRGRDSTSDPWKVLFAGKLFQAPERKYESNFCVDSYIAHDVWNDLERTVYQLTGFVAAGFNKSHVILFRDSTGNRMTAGHQIRFILEYARANGININYVQADLNVMNVQPPSDEQTDLSCSEAIQKCLRWQPGYYTRFEYSESGSTIRFLPESQEIDLRIPLTDVLKSGGFSIKKKSDMTLRGVVINYEVENKIIDGTTLSIQTDWAGATSGPDVLVHTVQVDGSYQIATEQSIFISVLDVPVNYKANLEFVRRFFPYVCNFPSNTTQNNLPASIPYPFYITSGYQSGYGISIYAAEFKWWVRYNRNSWNQLIDCSISSGNHYTEEWVSVTLNLTSSTSGTYTRPGTPITIPGELIPTGVATAIFAARQWPLYDGSFSREFSIAAPASPQNNINVLNGLAEYETMKAPVQRVARDYFNLTESIKFGHPEQAGITDYIDMLRNNRSVNRPSRRTWRT
jgi:hypothetical protein